MLISLIFDFIRLQHGQIKKQYVKRLKLIIGLDPDISPDEQEEKARLIAQVLELQNTLDGACILQQKFMLQMDVCVGIF